MENKVFNGVQFVRLRHDVGKYYLVADTDGVSICLTPQRGVHNTVWAVEHVHGLDDGLSVLLRGAYGRYLLATDVQAGTGPSHGVTVAQADLEQNDPIPAGMRWQAVERRGSFVLRCCLGRYLRANGRYLWWRRAIVTAAGDNASTMMQWDVQNVPVRLSRPGITEPIFQLTHRKNRRRVTEREVRRTIRFVRCELNGDINDAAWRTIRLRTNSTMQMRLTLASMLGRHHGMMTSTICVRAGRFARLNPLLVDLPVGNNTIDIIIVTHGTPADNILRYADLTAP